jgi:hypothetical protein
MVMFEKDEITVVFMLLTPLFLSLGVVPHHLVNIGVRYPAAIETSNAWHDVDST